MALADQADQEGQQVTAEPTDDLAPRHGIVTVPARRGLTTEIARYGVTMTEHDTTLLRAHIRALLDHHRGTQSALGGRTAEFAAMSEAGMTPAVISRITRDIAREEGATDDEMAKVIGASPANVSKSIAVVKEARRIAAEQAARPVHAVPPPENS
jgi:hypothetical protein